MVVLLTQVAALRALQCFQQLKESQPQHPSKASRAHILSFTASFPVIRSFTKAQFSPQIPWDRWKRAGTFSFFLTVILRDTQPAKLWDEAVQLRLHVVCNFHIRKASLRSLGYWRASLNVRQLFSISSFLRIPPSLPLSNSSTIVGWVVDAVSKECTMLHQDTRNPRPEAFSRVYAQEDGLIWQNWSLSFFCCHQEPCAQSGQEHLRPTEGLWLRLRKSLVSY